MKLPVTSRLYYSDSRLVDFTAVVAAVEGARVYLDRTAFYPTSGGQPHDLGQLGGSAVVDVVDEDDRIAHVLESPTPMAPGLQVEGRVQWTRRFDHMQQHTGQHLLSAVFEDLFGHRTMSVHFGDVSATLDLDTESLPQARVIAAERRANDVVLENQPVTIGFEDAASATGLRKAPDRTGQIRVVTIGAVDRSACGGTHVHTTGEIGPVFIRHVEKYKKLTRVEFLCGWRAHHAARADFDALSRVASTMTASIAELPALVESQAANLRASEAERRKLATELSRYQALEVLAAAAESADGIRRIIRRAAAMDDLRTLAQALSGMPRVLFLGIASSPPSAVFAASEDSGVNAGVALKAALAAHGGRGGGSPRVAQGTVDAASALDALEAALLNAGLR